MTSMVTQVRVYNMFGVVETRLDVNIVAHAATLRLHTALVGHTLWQYRQHKAAANIIKRNT